MIRPDFSIFDSAVLKASPAKASVMAAHHQQQIRGHAHLGSGSASLPPHAHHHRRDPIAPSPTCPRTPTSIKKRKDSGSSMHPTTYRRELERKLLETDYMLFQFRPSTTNTLITSQPQQIMPVPADTFQSIPIASSSLPSAGTSTVGSLLGVSTLLLSSSSPRDFLFSPGPSPLGSPALMCMKTPTPRSPSTAALATHPIHLLAAQQQPPKLSLDGDEERSVNGSPPPEQDAKRPLTSQHWQAAHSSSASPAFSGIAFALPPSNQFTAPNPSFPFPAGRHRRGGSGSGALSCASAASSVDGSFISSGFSSGIASSAVSARGSFSGITHMQNTNPSTNTNCSTQQGCVNGEALTMSSMRSERRSFSGSMPLHLNSQPTTGAVAHSGLLAIGVDSLDSTPIASCASFLHTRRRNNSGPAGLVRSLDQSRDRPALTEPGAPVAAFNVLPHKTPTQTTYTHAVQQQQPPADDAAFLNPAPSGGVGPVVIHPPAHAHPLATAAALTSVFNLPSGSTTAHPPTAAAAAPLSTNGIGVQSVCPSPLFSSTLLPPTSLFLPPPPLPSSLPPSPLSAAQFRWCALIGRGSFGEVWKVEPFRTDHDIGSDPMAAVALHSHTDGRPSPSPSPSRSTTALAIKKHLAPLANMTERRSFMRRTELLKQIVDAYNTHTRVSDPAAVNVYVWPPHLLVHHLIWQEAGLLYTLTDYCELGDLFQFFRVGALTVTDPYHAFDQNDDDMGVSTPVDSDEDDSRGLNMQPQRVTIGPNSIGRSASTVNVSAPGDSGVHADSLPESAPLTELDLLHLLSHICTALHLMHSLNILHGDVKPDNIYASRAPPSELPAAYPYVYTLGDLGSIASMSEWVSGHSEGDGSYLAYEVLREKGANITAKVDIYALGASLVTLITGEKFASSVLANDMAAAAAGRIVGAHQMTGQMQNQMPQAHYTRPSSAAPANGDMMTDTDLPVSFDPPPPVRASHSASFAPFPFPSHLSSGAGHGSSVLRVLAAESHTDSSHHTHGQCHAMANSMASTHACAPESPLPHIASVTDTNSSHSSGRFHPVVLDSFCSSAPPDHDDDHDNIVDLSASASLSISAPLVSLIRRMVSIHPRIRPTAEEIRKFAQHEIEATKHKSTQPNNTHAH